MKNADRRLPQEAPLPLLVDPQDELAREPRLLSDSRLLGALHAEFGERLGPEGTAATLLQLGYLHGLRDGLRILRGGFLDAGQAPAGALPTAPRLAIRLDAKPAGSTRGAIELTGSWPEHHEAQARSALLGGSPEASCFLSAGYTSGWLSGLHETELVAIESACASRGDPRCAFVAREPAVWRSAGAELARASLSALPFLELRRCVERELVREATAPLSDSTFDPYLPAVHVWLVMVLPFSGSEECLRAIDLIGRYPAAGEVSVVVLDLSGAVIDEGFGAVALENVLEAIEAWGAEPILAGVSPLSERVVGQLQGSHLVVRKDLPMAIASAFQIAHAQRRFL